MVLKKKKKDPDPEFGLQRSSESVKFRDQLGFIRKKMNTQDHSASTNPEIHTHPFGRDFLHYPKMRPNMVAGIFWAATPACPGADQQRCGRCNSVPTPFATVSAWCPRGNFVIKISLPNVSVRVL